MMRKQLLRASRQVAVAAIGLALAGGTAVHAANHREAPLTAIDTKADITDWFAFVSYDDPTKVTMILNVDPFLEPGNGPNYFPFDPEILYEMKVDNNFDAQADVVIQFSFSKPEIRSARCLHWLRWRGIRHQCAGQLACPVAPGTQIVPPAITALDGPGSEGFSLRQTYSIKVIRNGITIYQSPAGLKLFAVPSNVGPRTMPNYTALAQQGIYNLGNGMKVFAGTVDDPFYIDLGGAFDTLNFRVGASGVACLAFSAPRMRPTTRTSPLTLCPGSTSTPSRSNCRSRCSPATALCTRLAMLWP